MDQLLMNLISLNTLQDITLAAGFSGNEMLVVVMQTLMRHVRSLADVDLKVRHMWSSEFNDIAANIIMDTLHCRQLSFVSGQVNYNITKRNKTLNKITATWIESIEDQLKQIEILSSIIQQFNNF